MTQRILYTTEDGKSELDQWAVVTTQMRSGHEATVKRSLSVKVEAGRVATTEECSVVHLPKQNKP